MAVTMNARWDNSGTVIPGGNAEYVVAEQPIAEYDNWFNYNVVSDIQAVIDDVINRFNANTILKADTDNTPAALVVAEQTIVGRKTGNSIAALVDSEVLSIIGVAAGATKYPDTGEQAFLDADHSKLDGIELLADVTDATNVTAASAVMDADFSAAEGFMRKTGAGAYTVIKSNLGAAVAPTVNEDSGDGYGVGSQWIDTTADKAYICLDNSSGAAVWHIISPIWDLSIGDIMYHAHDDEETTTSGTYVKMKTMTLDYIPCTTLRISFDIHGTDTGPGAHAKIYRNGAGVGTERQKGQGAYETFIENISGWSAGDTLELWMYEEGGNSNAYCQNFRILGSRGITNS